MPDLVDMIRSSFGDAMADSANHLLQSGQGEGLTLLQLLHEAERAHCGSLDALANRRTTSRIEEIDDDEPAEE